MTVPAVADLGDDDVELAVESVQGGATLGTVRRAGSRASHLIDQLVLAGPIDPCGECEVCRRGGAPVCPTARRRTSIGAHVVAAARWVVPVGDLQLPRPEAAAVAGDANLAYTMYARTGIGPREPTVVVGATPVTRFLVDVLRAKGIAPVVVADPERTAWCDHLTSRGVAHAARADARVRAQAVFAEQGLGNRPWRVIVTAVDDVEVAAALCGPRATLTVPAGIAALPGSLATHEVTIITVAAAHPDLIVEVAALCARGDLELVGGTSPSADPALRAVLDVREPAHDP